MYWGNVPKLAEDLREGRVDEKDRFKYYLATFTALSIVVPVIFYSVGPLGADDLIYLIASAVTGITGIILCYRVNRSGDNTDFIPRMICLSWSVAVFGLVVLFLFPLSVRTLIEAAHGFRSFLAYEPGTPLHAREFFSGLASLSSAPILVAAYYGFIYFYLVQISQAKEGRILAEIITSNLSIGKAAVAVLMFPGTVFVFLTTEDFIKKHEFLDVTAQLGGYVAVVLWLLLLGWILAVSHKRSVKDS